MLGLHAQFLETAQGELVGIFHPNEHHQSYPGRVHGGICAAMLDELIGRAANIENPDLWGVTIELKTKYRKPVPYDGPVTARARITRDTSRVFEGTGEILLDDGTIAVQAWGRYLTLPMEKINAQSAASMDTEIQADNRIIPDFVEVGL